jgi:hypothetical protein
MPLDIEKEAIVANLLLPLHPFLSTVLPGVLVLVILSLRLGFVVSAQQVAVLFAAYGRDFAVSGHLLLLCFLSDFSARGRIFQLSFSMAFVSRDVYHYTASVGVWLERWKRVYTYACISTSS